MAIHARHLGCFIGLVFFTSCSWVRDVRSTKEDVRTVESEQCDSACAVWVKHGCADAQVCMMQNDQTSTCQRAGSCAEWCRSLVNDGVVNLRPSCVARVEIPQSDLSRACDWIESVCRSRTR